MLLNNVLGMTEMTFLMKRAMFHPLKQGGCFWMEHTFLEVTFTLKSKCFITLYNYIYIYIIHTIMYLIHILQYMLNNVFVLRSFC